MWDTFEDFHPLSRKKKDDLLLEGAVRTDCGLSGMQLDYGRAEIGISFTLPRHFQIRPYYFLVINEPGTKRKSVLSVEVSENEIKIYSWHLNEKNRFEEDFNPTERTSRYANELQLFPPVPEPVTKLMLSPYAKGQAKYDLRHLRWVYTRLYFGVQKGLGKRLRLDGFFVRQFGSHLSPGSFNGIGMTVRTYF